MGKSRFALGALLVFAGMCGVSGCTDMLGIPGEGKTVYRQWKQGPSAEASFFPIAVWLQDPVDAEKYKAAGINTYVALWEGPTEEQLEMLRKAGIGAFCEVNDVARKHMNDPVIVGWMHGDEPDNAQTSPGKDAAGKPLPNQPIPPADVIAEYEKYRKMDPSRPIMLNLGQGVANDDWPGRGHDNGNFEVYKEYAKAGDILSYDVYPVSGNRISPRGNLALEARGLDRLKQWTHGQKILWNCIECTQINGDRPEKITPQQMRSCVWISLVHGSTGLIYFVHQFGAGKSPRHLLEDPPMLAEVTAVNKEIKELAPVLNSPTVTGAVKVEAGADAPVDVMVKRHGGKTYIFAVGMTKNNGRASFEVSGMKGSGSAEVIGEGRTVALQEGKFADDFSGFAVHRYVIRGGK